MYRFVTIHKSHACRSREWYSGDITRDERFFFFLPPTRSPKLAIRFDSSLRFGKPLSDSSKTCAISFFLMTFNSFHFQKAHEMIKLQRNWKILYFYRSIHFRGNCNVVRSLFPIGITINKTFVSFLISWSSSMFIFLPLRLSRFL